MSMDPGPMEGALLLALARGAVAEELGATCLVTPDQPWLDEPAATFVTIYQGTGGESLHGCIGSIDPRRSLAQDIRENARMAAFHDPRSRALRADELDWVRFSISVLGPRSPIPFTSEADARGQLRPGIDGLVLSFQGHRGVFLPQVWETLPEPGAFLDNLKRKAGLATDFWDPDLLLERFEVMQFAEPHAVTNGSPGWH